MNQQLLLKEKLPVSQILRTYGKQFTQITERYFDGRNGRCVLGVIMSYFGWDGRVDFDSADDIVAISDVLKQAGIDEDLLTDLERLWFDI
jgi:hypothetical protein